MKTIVITEHAEAIDALAATLAAHHQIAVFTGAGVSVDSGVPDFRSPGGVWAKIDPSMLSRPAIEGRGADRAAFWRAMLAIGRAVGEPRPNPIHTAIARLEAAGRSIGVVTQNIDGLHQAAGSRAVIELHGSMTHCRCTGCPARWTTAEIFARVAAGDRAPDCEHCGGIIRPDLVLFGDLLPPEALGEAGRWMAACDLCVVLGSSLVVYPAADLPREARRAGARLAIATLGQTPLDRLAHLKIDAPLGAVWPAAVARALRRGAH